MIKVSVIVPLMIREDQLARTMDSLSRQTLEDFEVILVGDGAPHYEVLDERIKVIAGLDGGKGAAFNRGLASAGGDYILSLAEENDADLLVFGQVHPDLPTQRDFRIHFGEYYQETEDGLGNKLYKREFLKKMRYDSRIRT